MRQGLAAAATARISVAATRSSRLAFTPDDSSQRTGTGTAMTPEPGRTRRSGALVAAAVTALITVVGCSSGGATSRPQSATPAAPSISVQGPGAASAQPSAGYVYRIGQSFVLPGTNNTGSFRLAVDGVSETVSPAAVQAYASAYGGAASPLATQPDPG